MVERTLIFLFYFQVGWVNEFKPRWRMGLCPYLV